MSAEALLGQNVSLIYHFIEQAVTYRTRGEHWQALNMLDTAASLMYLDESKAKPLEELAQKITNILEETKKIKHSSQEVERDVQFEYLDREAAQCFNSHLKALRNYMQEAGYYVMMNKSWNSKITPTSTMQTQNQPPQTKIYRETLPSEII